MGNHDKTIPQRWPGEYCQSLELHNIHFLHEPEPFPRYQIVGHFHPKFTARLQGTKVSGRSFVKNPHLLVMPAFGRFTGGLSVEDPALKTLFQPPVDGLFLCHRQQVFSLRPP